MDKKLKRRLVLFDDMLDYLLRSSCCFAFCDGPLAPIRHQRTCIRCSAIHRAIQMGLVKENKATYRNEKGYFVEKGVLEQFSVLDGKKL